jgi:hypothetical protein
VVDLERNDLGGVDLDANDLGQTGPNITEFLRAQLDDLQAKAEACEAEIGRERAGEQFADGSGTADRDAFPSYPWGSGDAELAYLAAVHPRVVLADVAAKRAIIAEHGPGALVDSSDGRYFVEPENWDPPWQKCVGHEHVEYPCSTLRLLALPHAGHPQYREEWRP